MRLFSIPSAGRLGATGAHKDARVGAVLGSAVVNKEACIVIQSLSAKGTGRSSGMLQVGDVIKRVDLQDTAGMQPGQVHQLLQGLPGSTVSVKYQRPPSNLDMRCTLIRETGTEHVLKEHHGGWKTHDLTDNRARGDEARRKAENINHGYVKINENAVRHKEEKFTAAELAEHFERRKAEDEANIKAADELVARLQARDDKERHQKGADFAQKNPNAKWNPFAQREHHATEEARWRMQQWGLGGRTQDDFARDQAERLKLEREREPSWWNPFHHKSNSTAVGELPKQGATKPWYDFMPAHQDRTKETKLALLKAVATGKEADIVNAAAQHKMAKTDKTVHGMLHGKAKKKDNWWDFGTSATSEEQRAKEQRAKPGEHHWPWESRGKHDEKFLDKDVPMPWDMCMAPRQPRGG